MEVFQDGWQSEAQQFLCRARMQLKRVPWCCHGNEHTASVAMATHYWSVIIIMQWCQSEFIVGEREGKILSGGINLHMQWLLSPKIRKRNRAQPTRLTFWLKFPPLLDSKVDSFGTRISFQGKSFVKGVDYPIRNRENFVKHVDCPVIHWAQAAPIRYMYSNRSHCSHMAP